MHPEILHDLARDQMRDRLQAASDGRFATSARCAPIPLMTDTGRVVALFLHPRCVRPQTATCLRGARRI